MRTLTQIAAAVGSAIAVAGVLAACGGGTGSTSAAAATASPSANSAARAGLTEYLSCLRANGANVPTAFPTGGFNRPSDGFSPRPTGVRRSGGFGGFGQNPQNQAAAQACASVRPTGGFGGFGGFGRRGGTQLAAFRNCMTQQGVAIPTTRPTAPPTAFAQGVPGAGRALNGLNPNDPKVAAALKVCAPLLASPGARPTGSPTG
jgi:hypothetical protein